jgi:hypothetical protein
MARRPGRANGAAPRTGQWRGAVGLPKGAAPGADLTYIITRPPSTARTWPVM